MRSKAQPPAEGETLLNELTRIACEIYREWDSDNDSRVGKMIGALGGVKGYRADIDALRASLAALEVRVPPSQGETLRADPTDAEVNAAVDRLAAQAKRAVRGTSGHAWRREAAIQRDADALKALLNAQPSPQGEPVRQLISELREVAILPSELLTGDLVHACADRLEAALAQPAPPDPALCPHVTLHFDTEADGHVFVTAWNTSPPETREAVREKLREVLLGMDHATGDRGLQIWIATEGIKEALALLHAEAKGSRPPRMPRAMPHARRLISERER